MRRDRLELDAVPDAVPRARRFVAWRLADWNLTNLVSDAEFAVTELVTNALLHAGPPIAVVVHAATALRIAVHDPSPIPPIRTLAGPEAMTGRGLALVEAMSDRWGVERTEGGKAVWCELDFAGDREHRAVHPDPVGSADIDTFLAGWDDLIPQTREPTFEVTLGDVPTDLLLAAKAHVDNVVRELALVRAGAATGDTAGVPAHLARLLEDVVTGFADARNAIKRQALEAAAKGEERVRLRLTLPPSAAAAGERYLAGLDDADAYARASRLLTLEAPPQHRVFRHWYVRSLVTQLRRSAAGETAELPPTFEQYLLGEVEAIADAQRASDRAARLQRVAGALASSATPTDVADVVVGAAVAALGAQAGVLLLAERGLVTGVAGQVGYDTPVIDRIVKSARTEPMPAALTASTGEPVWVESPEERDARFPTLAGIEPTVVSLCVVPLAVAGEVRGLLRFSFSEVRLFDTEEREFVLALAAQAAQAIERARLYDAQDRLARRLTRLHKVTAALAATRELADVNRVVIDHATGVLGAEVGAVCLLTGNGDELEIAAWSSPHPEQISRFRRFSLDADLPGAEAVRDGKPIVLPSIAERDARYPVLAGLPAVHEHTLVCLPLTVDDHPIGSLNLSLPGADAVDADELEFLTALAEVCAQSLDRARALDDARAAAAKLALLADASAELASSLDYQRTLARVAQLAVPRLGDWCAVHVAESVTAEPGTAAAGVPKVVRTGRSELYPEVTEELLAALAGGPEDLDRIRGLGLASALVVPLTAHDRVLGAIALARSEAGGPYTGEDVALAEDLARRAALAIDHAKLYQDATAIRSR